MTNRMNLWKRTIAPLAMLLLLGAGAIRCGGGKENPGALFTSLFYILNQTDEYQWNLPTGFPVPYVPADNPMSEVKVKLGRRLFYDKRLSRTVSKSCASCHIQSRAFTDGRSLAIGLDVDGDGIVDPEEVHLRNAQHLTNAAYPARYNWANNEVRYLEDQSTGPLFQNGAPIPEMGLTTDLYRNESLARLRSDDQYPALFASAFGSETIDFDRVRKALAAFERTLISGNSPFDRYYYEKDTSGMSPAAITGAEIFFGEKAECFHCHGGFNFSDTNFHDSTVIEEIFFHSNGLYNDTDYADPSRDGNRGLKSLTGLAGDLGRFRAPSLRNVALTYPYMHDGSIRCDSFAEGESWRESCARESLLKVVEHYAAGGRCYDSFGVLTDCSTLDSSLVRPISLTTEEKNDLVEFLLTLTDEEFLTRSDLSNPEPADPNFGE